MLHSTAALEMMALRRYKGPPGSSHPRAQPFTVAVHASVLPLADAHAHATMHEVIGFLAGRWHPDRLVLEVLQIFPGKSLKVSGGTVGAWVSCHSAEASGAVVV